jgi:hypothetical protein
MNRKLQTRCHSQGSVSTGFDWASGLIGAGGALGIAIVGAGSVIALRRRGSPSHV